MSATYVQRTVNTRVFAPRHRSMVYESIFPMIKYL